MLNVGEVVPVNPVAAAASRYPLAALSMLRFENGAIPFVAPTAVVPESVPDLGFVAIDIVTVFPAPVTRLPPASCTSTWIAGEIATLPVEFDGGTRNPSFAGAPTVMLKDDEVACVRPDAVAFSV